MKKDIAFIIYYPFQFYIYKNIYKHLLDRSIFIIDLYNFSEHDEINTFGSIKDLLKKNNIEYKVIKKEEYKISSVTKVLFSDIKVMVSVWGRGCMSIDATRDILKVYSSYGVGKELLKVVPELSMFDLIINYGKSSYRYYSLFARTVMIGNAKFDDFYNDDLDYALVQNLRLSKSKKTILYLPTHSNLGSFRQVMPELIKLKDKYNILVKIHYFIEREESEFIAELNLTGLHFLKDDVDLSPLLKVCDLAISDNSSVIFDVIQADKPLLLEDIWNEEFFEKDIQGLGKAKRGITAPLTYPDSIEQKIKREGKVVLNKDVNSMERDIEHALNKDNIYSQYRKGIISDTIEYTDGNSGKRGAEAILGLMSGEIEPRKGIMYYRDMREVSLYQRKQFTDVRGSVSWESFDVNSIQYVIFCENSDNTHISLSSILDMEVKKENMIMVGSQMTEKMEGVKYSEYLNTDNFTQGKKTLFLRAGVVVERKSLSKLFNSVNVENMSCVSLRTVRKYSDMENMFINLKLPFLKSLTNKNAYFKTDLFYNFHGYIPSEFNAVLIGESLATEIFKREGVIKTYEEIIFLLNIIPDKIKVVMLNVFPDINFIKDSPVLLLGKSIYFSFLQKYSIVSIVRDISLDLASKKCVNIKYRLKIFWITGVCRFVRRMNFYKKKLAKETE
jgi:hypothetical protein